MTSRSPLLLPASLAGLALSGCAMSGCAMSAPAMLPEASGSSTAKHNVVIDFVDGLSLDEAREISGLDSLDWVSPRSADESLAVVEVADVDGLIVRLSAHRSVEVVEPVVTMQALGVPDDPMYAQQWNLRTIDAPAGWRSGGGRGITVAIIDTGVTVVPDLAGTAVLEGYSFVSGEPTSRDGNGHGTHVAGTVAQATNNGLGVAGIAPEATILPLKALNAQGSGNSAWIASAIDEAADQGAHIINMSLGGGYSGVIATAVQKAQERGVLVIAAAGNSGHEGVSYPAALPGVIGVSATGPHDELAPYSSWGKGVDISAPGGNKLKEGGGILQNTVVPSKGTDASDYLEFQGTSMATPHVAGAAAIIWSATGGDAEHVASRLLGNSKDLGEEGFDTRFGHGRLDIGAALHGVRFAGQGLLFGLAWVAAWLLSGLGGNTRRSRTLTMAASAGVAAGGLFFLDALPLPAVFLTDLLSQPLLRWPAVFLGEPWARNPLLLSALAPAVLTFVLGPTRLLGPIVAGVSTGVGVHLLHGALTGSLQPWMLPGVLGDVWLGTNGALALLCAIAVVGVQRMRDRQDAEGTS